MELKPGYKLTEAGVIPEDWNVTPVGHSFDICNNLRMPISHAVREKMVGPFPYYGPTSVQGYINEFRVEGEYALIGEDGDHFLKWQDQPMTQMVSGRFNVNNHAHLIKGTKNVTAWFYYYFSHRDLTPYLTRQGAGRYKLTKSTLTEIPCAIPPTRAEQEAIAEVLSGADALIESLARLIVKKRHLKQGTLQELLRPRDPWATGCLGELFHLFSGRSKSSVLSQAGKFVVMDMGSVSSDGRLLATKRTDCEEDVLNFGDLVMPKDDIGGGQIIGRVAFIDSDNGYVLGDHVYRLQKKNPRVDPLFFYYLINSGRVNQELKKKVAGSAQLGLGRARVLEQDVTFPETPAEQTTIATVLSDMDKKIAALEAKLTKARQLKQGMMQELLAGRTRLI